MSSCRWRHYAVFIVIFEQILHITSIFDFEQGASGWEVAYIKLIWIRTKMLWYIMEIFELVQKLVI